VSKNTPVEETAKEITPALTFIFQASINQSKIPSDWKTAIVAPVFKKGDRGQPSNYIFRRNFRFQEHKLSSGN
jgi:hypothetical protein